MPSSVSVSTQELPQQELDPVQPAPPPHLHEPLTQVSLMPQGWLQPPQWLVLVLVSTQRVPQQVIPLVQSLPVPPHLQLPLSQVSPASHT